MTSPTPAPASKIPSGTVIRRARREDCPAILAIYNEAVLNTTASYDVEPRSLEQRLAWFDDHYAHDYAVCVAECDGAVRGWASLSRYHDRFGYRFTAEDSLYIAPEYRGRGLGGMLLRELIESARQRRLHSPSRRSMPPMKPASGCTGATASCSAVTSARWDTNSTGGSMSSTCS